MRTLTLGQINELENKEPIPRFVGTIRKVLDQKTDHGQYGQWWLQTLFVGEEGNANDIAVTWTGEDPFDSGCEGKLYSFECTTDKNGKLVGVQREIRTVKKKDNKTGEITSKTYKGVKVDNRSKIKLETGGTVQTSSVQETLVDEDWPEALETAPESPPARSNGNGGVNDARKHLMQAANLMLLCLKSAKHVCQSWKEQGEGELPNEHFQGMVHSFFINGTHETWWSGKIVKESLLSKMPSNKPL